MTDLFTRAARGWALTKASLNVLRLDTEILLLPVLSGIVLLLLAAGVLGSIVLGALGGAEPSPVAVALALLAVYFVGYFVVIFFNTAVVAMATLRFEGKDPVLKDGLGASWANVGRILQWALIAATVGLVLRLLREQMRERAGFLGALLGHLLEIAWSAVVYFVIPVMVYRQVGPLQAIRESTGLLRRTWGEAAAGEISMGLIFTALGLLGAGALAFVAFTAGTGAVFLVTFAAVVLYWLVLAVVSSAAQGILTAALYRYATTGQVPMGFDRSTMANAVA